MSMRDKCVQVLEVCTKNIDKIKQPKSTDANNTMYDWKCVILAILNLEIHDDDYLFLVIITICW